MFAQRLVLWAQPLLQMQDSKHVSIKHTTVSLRMSTCRSVSLTQLSTRPCQTLLTCTACPTSIMRNTMSDATDSTAQATSTWCRQQPRCWANSLNNSMQSPVTWVSVLGPCCCCYTHVQVSCVWVVVGAPSQGHVCALSCHRCFAFSGAAGN